MKKLVMLAVIAAMSMLSAADVFITDTGSGTGTVTWTSNNVYYLENFVFVNAGQHLTIQPGTVIKGRYGTGADASALIVARGASATMEGTPTHPIIFTSEYDDLSAPLMTKGLWGGLIILGSGELNSTEKEARIEGIPETEPRGIYGGGLNPNNVENSGTYRYISIRHGGTEIGAANEINGLTMGAVGSGTTIDHIEVIYNKDDAFEWFGGTVNCKYLVAAFSGDDDFDYDVGYRGRGQFWFCIKEATTGDKSGEHDGGTDPEDGTPFAIPTIYNVTYMGSGITSTNNVSGGFNIRDNAGGHYKNGIFTDYPGYGITVEDLASGADSRQRFETGDITFTNNLWFGFKNGNTKEVICNTKAYIYPLFDQTARKNFITDPQLRGISRTNNGGLDPRPQSNTARTEYFSVTPDGFYESVDFMGAFDPDAALWTDGWTYLSQYGWTPMAAPFVTTSVTGTTLTLTWNAVGGATSYDVYSADDPYGTFTFLTNVAATQWTTSASAAKKFYYVRSKN
jgi:hypothetical protein